MIFKRFCLTIVLFLSTWSFAAPTPQLYKVELIIFAHITPYALSNELWPATPDMPKMGRVRNLKPLPVTQTTDPATGETSLNLNPAATPVPYQILPFNSFDLNKAAKVLTPKRDYPILVHVAWLQPGMPVKNSPRIHIYGGTALSSDGSKMDGASPLNIASADLSNLNADVSQVPQWELNGFVRVSQPYLFQLDADLVLTIPKDVLASLPSTVTNKLKTNHFILRQTFRMKLGDVYYIDHPLFGILAEVNKYKPSP